MLLLCCCDNGLFYLKDEDSGIADQIIFQVTFLLGKEDEALRANQKPSNLINLFPERIVLLIAGNTLIRLNILSRSVQLCGELIPWRDNKRRMGLKETINVFEGPIGGLRVEEVSDGNEGEADYCPDDPEFPL